MDLPQWANVQDGVLFIIAIYGAALSTFNWRQAVKRDQRQITSFDSDAHLRRPVGKSLCEAGSDKHRSTGCNHQDNIVRATNWRPSVFHDAGGIPGMPETPLPASLSDGQTAFLLMSYEEIGSALLQSGKTGKTKLTPICVDTAENVYRGEPWEVNPQEFLQMGT